MSGDRTKGGNYSRTKGLKNALGEQRYIVIKRESDFGIYDVHSADVIYIPYDAIPFLITELEKLAPLEG